MPQAAGMGDAPLPPALSDEGWMGWLAAHRIPVDIALAAAATVAVLWTVRPLESLRRAWGPSLISELLTPSLSGTSDARGWALLALAAAMTVPWAWRSRAVGWACLVPLTAAWLHLLAGVALLVPADLVLAAVVYNAAARAGRSVAAATLWGTAGWVLVSGAMLAGSARGPGAMVGIWVTGLTSLLGAWGLGAAHKARQQHVAELRARAARLAVERDQQSRLAVNAERTRIAREMHDIVSHSLSVIIAQADGGRYVAAADPPAAQRALETIAHTGRSALADMRRLLGVLRSDPDDDVQPLLGESPATDAVPLVPQPDIDALPALVEQVTAAGARVSYAVIGQARPVPAGVGLAVYRVCQEALTNVLKHAGPDPEVTVMVLWRPTSLRLVISDDGRGAAANPDATSRGHGLPGMRERAALYGGSLTAGPRPGGGFQVTLTLPLPPEEDTDLLTTFLDAQSRARASLRNPQDTP